MNTKRKLIRKKLTQYKRGGLKRLYATGGSQYDNNTVSAAGQGSPSNTIINVESNRDALKQRALQYQAMLEQDKANKEKATSDVMQLKQAGQQNIQQAAASANSQVEGYANIAKELANQYNTFKPKGEVDPGITPGTGTGVGTKADDLTKSVLAKTDKQIAAQNLTKNTAQKSFEQAQTMERLKLGNKGAIGSKTTSTPKLSVNTTKNLSPSGEVVKSPLAGATKSTGTDAVAAAGDKVGYDWGSQSQGVGAAVKAYKAQRATNKAIKAGTLMQSSAGSAAGAGWKALGSAGKANVIGTVAALAGEGIKKWSDDDDATTVHAGEGIGAGIAGAGAGIGAAATAGMIMGSAVPVAGNIIGAAVGALYGVGKSLFARNKARKAESKMKKEIQERKDKYNTELGDNYATQKGMMMGVQNKLKEQSGYDTGARSVVRFGGRRLQRAVA